MKKLWKFTANGVGWANRYTFYFESREEAEQEYKKYTYKDPIEYAGRFTEKNANILLGHK